MKPVKKNPRKPAKAMRKPKSGTKPKKPAPVTSEHTRKLIHLLEVSQVELEHQNQELRIAEAELEASRSKYVNLFDFSPIPYFALDVDGVIREVNLSAGRLFGFDRSKLAGKRISAFMPPEDRGPFAAFLARIFTSSDKQSCNVKVINKDKHVLHVLLEGIKSNDTLEPEERCQIALIDLSAYKALEKSFEEVSEELKSLKRGKDELRD
jgi:two-component system, chemotaxis family, sensor kinase Cph1